MTDSSLKADAIYSGISTFGRLPYAPCLKDKSIKYDLAFIGKKTSHESDTVTLPDQLQVLHSIQAQATGQALASVQTASGKVRVASTSSMSP